MKYLPYYDLSLNEYRKAMVLNNLPTEISLEQFFNNTDVGIAYKKRFKDFERVVRKMFLTKNCGKPYNIIMLDEPIEEYDWKERGSNMIVKEIRLGVVCDVCDSGHSIQIYIWRRKRY